MDFQRGGALHDVVELVPPLDRSDPVNVPGFPSGADAGPGSCTGLTRMVTP